MSTPSGKLRLGNDAAGSQWFGVCAVVVCMRSCRILDDPVFEKSSFSCAVIAQLFQRFAFLIL
jgi:hypothetical protein